MVKSKNGPKVDNFVVAHNGDVKSKHSQDSFSWPGMIPESHWRPPRKDRERRLVAIFCSPSEKA